MEKHEQKFWNFIRPMVPGHAQRIENSCGNGVPDVNIACSFRECWLELKVAQPGKTGMEVLLRKEQFAWGMRRSTEMCRVVVLAESGEMAWAWEFPRVEAVAYGTSEKYVRIVNVPYIQFPRSQMRRNLKNILFPGVTF